MNVFSRRLCLLLLCAAPFSVAAPCKPRRQLVHLPPRVQSSVPEFIEIRIQENSTAATYEIRQLDEDGGRYSI